MTTLTNKSVAQRLMATVTETKNMRNPMTPQFMVCILSSIPVIFFSQQALAANILLNGGFEEPALDRGAAQLKSIPGWTSLTTKSTIEVQRGLGGGPFEGKQHIELDSQHFNLNPDDEIGIFQDVLTNIGKTYRLSFAFSSKPNSPDIDNKFRVNFGDVFNMDFESGAGKPGSGNWQTFSTLVTAKSDLTRLQFTYTGNVNTAGSNIDDVRLEPEPVPEPLTLLGSATALGVGGLLKRQHSKKQKQDKKSA